MSVACAAGCETTAEKPVAVAVEPEPLELSPGTLCTVRAAVADAAAQGTLAARRAAYQKAGDNDRAAVFGALLSIEDDQARFRAFHDEGEQNQASVVGPLGECFVYSAWRMPDRAAERCAAAQKKLGPVAIVDTARAELALQSGDAAAAEQHAVAALNKDPACQAARLVHARAAVARGDVDAALSRYDAAAAAAPACFVCAAEAAALVEEKQGAAAAASRWQQAAERAPGHGPTQARYAVAVSATDPAAARAAYDRAIAAGQNDVTTLLAAASLAQGDDPRRALELALRAAQKKPDDAAAWQLALSLSQGRDDAAAQAEQAAGELVRLGQDDLAVRAVALRAAVKAERHVDAFDHAAAAQRFVADKKTAPLDDAGFAAVQKEARALFRELEIADKPARGSPTSVVRDVQGTVQTLYERRARRRKGMAGAIEVVVRADKEGAVEAVEIRSDTLGDAVIAASVIGNLRRATINGGARQYAFTLEFSGQS